MLSNFKNLTQKTRSSSRWNFSSGSLSALESAVSLRGCVGRVDAEKLAQRSSVAAWLLNCWPEYTWCHLNSSGCFPSDLLPNCSWVWNCYSFRKSALLLITISINGWYLYLTISINGCQMLGGHTAISPPRICRACWIIDRKLRTGALDIFKRS